MATEQNMGVLLVPQTRQQFGARIEEGEVMRGPAIAWQVKSSRRVSVPGLLSSRVPDGVALGIPKSESC